MKFNVEPFEYIPSPSFLKKIKIVMSNEKLTAAAGLGTIVELFDQSGLKNKFIKCLPERSSPRSIGSYKLALNMISGFIHGFDCLDDFDTKAGDPALAALFDEESPAARTMGDYLRSFEEENIEDLNKFLSHMGLSLFHAFERSLPEEHRPTMLCQDIDSTDHPQSSNKMEGVAWNFKNHWCLDSQVIFDQMGLCHGFDLRSGNTKSGVGADWLLDQALNTGKTQRLTRFEGKSFVRGDSAYCTQDVIKVLLKRGVLFTLTAHDGLTHWKDLLSKEGISWSPWLYSLEQQEWAKEKNKALPEVELGVLYFSPKWLECGCWIV